VLFLFQMAVYLALFAVMWRYAPADDEEEEGEQDEGDDCCSLLGGGTGGAVGGTMGGASSASNSMDMTRPTQHSTTERGTDSSAELGLGGIHAHVHPSLRNPSVDSRPTVGGALGFAMGGAPGGYDINSRNSSFASVRSDRSNARKNSIAEVGLRTAFG